MRYFSAESELERAASLLQEALKYSPDQPRVPAGQSDGGQWRRRRGNDAPDTTQVAGPFNDLNRVKCDAQMERDMFQCTFVSSARFRSACENQAMSRWVACMKDDLIPPFTYIS